MILITGAAGFIGFHLARKLHTMGEDLLLVDDMSNGAASEARKAILEAIGLKVWQDDVSSPIMVLGLFADNEITAVVHLAAMPGVRKGPEMYREYLERNIMATQNMLEFCRQRNIPRFIYASSSSVYGGLAMSEQPSNQVQSMYAASKRACEAIADVYSRIHGIQCIGLRFFTVYGEHGRPDMAYYNFLNAMSRGESITVHKGMMRDMTHVNDVVRAIVMLVNLNSHKELHDIWNIGTGQWHSVEELVSLLEKHSGYKANVQFTEPHPADMRWSLADISKISAFWKPLITLDEGIKRFCLWHRENN